MDGGAYTMVGVFCSVFQIKAMYLFFSRAAPWGTMDIFYGLRHECSTYIKHKSRKTMKAKSIYLIHCCILFYTLFPDSFFPFLSSLMNPFILLSSIILISQWASFYDELIQRQESSLSGVSALKDKNASEFLREDLKACSKKSDTEVQQQNVPVLPEHNITMKNWILGVSKLNTFPKEHSFFLANLFLKYVDLSLILISKRNHLLYAAALPLFF